MKEQDAAHSSIPNFEAIWDTFIEDYAFQVPYDGSNKFYNDSKVNDHRLKAAVQLIYEKHFIAELTRLRSELQQKDELIKELIPIVEQEIKMSTSVGYTYDKLKSLIAKSKAK